MTETKYVELDHVKELLKLIRHRDTFMDWTDEHEESNEQVENYIRLLENSAKRLIL